MHKKLNFLISFLLALLIFTFGFNPPKHQFNLKSNLNSNIIVEKNELLEIIHKLNEKNSLINNLVVKIKIRDKLTSLTGDVFYEKDKNFRMYTYSLFGLEGDIGSNEDIFWFWSKRYNQSTLFYVKHEDIEKTRLKSQYKPSFLIENFGLSCINDDCDISISENRVKLLFVNDNFKIEKILNIKKLFFDKISVFENDKLIYDCSVIKYQLLNNNFYYPQILEIKIYDENITFYWYLEDPKFNQKINKIHWQKPNFNNQIDLSEY